MEKSHEGGKKELNASDLRQLLKGLQENIVTMMSVFGFRHLNYTQKQLEAVEDKIEQEYPLGHQPQITTIFTFGFFLGECIIKANPGSKWKIADDAKSPFDMVIEIPSDEDGTPAASASPMTRVRKYWFDRSDKPSTLLRMVCQMTELKLDPEYNKKRADRNGWIQTYYGDRYRQLEASPELLEKVKGQTPEEAMNTIIRENRNGNK